MSATYDYTNDELGRRTRVDHSGPAFMTYSYYAAHTYNARSELTSTQRHLAAPPYTLLSPGVYGYTYHHIGNRQTSAVDGTGRTYTANDLNQYDSITNPAEALDHDDDGNMLQDVTFNYTWDAENRLVEAVTRIEVGASSTAYETGDKHVYFAYDYMGRRVHKRVETFNGSSWPETSDELLVYDGWNVVMVLDGLNSNATTRKYTWGLDLSGSIHGAGGIGGLLACEEPQTVGDPKRYWFLYDANGNVGQVLDATDVNSITIAAHYEYDPYGNVINSSGAYKDVNPFKFSTKWFDAETDLGYWGYRYYSPRLGRWISRDPMGDVGGLNYYGFASNNALCYVDAHGLFGLFPGPVRPYYPMPPGPPPAPPEGGTCGADVTSWLVSTLNINGSSLTVDDMDACCHLAAAGRLAPVFTLGWWYGCNCYIALRDFRDKVKPGGPWDFKSDPGFGKGTASPTGSCGSTVTICGKCYNRDVPGNINYGMTGTLGCVNKSTLLKQADKVAPGGVDSPEDKEAILLGVRLADYWPTITKDTFCKEFDQVSSKLEKSGTQNCEPSNEIWPSMIPPIR